MTIAVCCIAIGLLVLFAGGPGELLHVLDRAVRSLAAAVETAYHNLHI
jgi:hypothetical protein